MKLCFTNEQTVSTWFERIQNPMQIGLKVYSANYRIHSDGRTLYSYGSHFPLVRWYPEQKIFLTNYNERCSNSTSKHQNYVHRHVPDNHIEVSELLRHDPLNHPEDYLSRWDNLVRETLVKAKRARKYTDSYLAVAGRYLIDRKRFTEVFGIPTPELPEDVTAALVTLKLAA